MFKNKFTKNGFSLIELLIVVAIIGILSSIVLSAMGGVREKARDAKRKAEIAGIGRLITASCYVPTAGAGVYDIADLIAEFAVTYPQYTKYISQVPKDPKLGTDTQSFYMYTVNASGKCAVYANLENENEKITLQNISEPTAGGGTGVLEHSSTEGPNGTLKYFQVSN